MKERVEKKQPGGGRDYHAGGARLMVWVSDRWNETMMEGDTGTTET